jgi:hypothetical protein
MQKKIKLYKYKKKEKMKGFECLSKYPCTWKHNPQKPKDGSKSSVNQGAKFFP